MASTSSSLTELPDSPRPLRSLSPPSAPRWKRPPPDPAWAYLQPQAQEILNPQDSWALPTFLYDLYNSTSSSIVQEDTKNLLNYLKNNYLGSFSIRLASFLRSCNPQLIYTRNTTLDLLSSLLTREGHRLWTKLPIMQRNIIKPTFLDCLKKESSRTFLPKLCHFVSDVASENVPGNEWPELIGFIFESFDGNSEVTKECALLVLCKLAPGGAGEGLVFSADSLYAKLMEILDSDITFEVKLPAVKASVSFILYWTNPSNQDRYLPLLVYITQTLFLLLNANKEKYARTVMKEMMELAGAKPGFFGIQFENVVETMFIILENNDFEDETRFLGLEFVLVLAEERVQARGMLLQSPHFIERALSYVLVMLAVIRDDAAWKDADTDEKIQGETATCAHGIESLYRLAAALGWKILLQNYPKSFVSHLASEEWQRRHAAVMFPAVIAEICSKELKQTMDHIVGRVIKIVKEDVHPRVRWAAMNTIRQFSIHLSPEFQHRYHQEVLPAIIKAMDDFDNPRIQAQAASAMFQFTKKCTANILRPCLNEIVNKLLKYLEKGKPMLKRAALRALASIVTLLEEQFQEYYSTVMPSLKVIMMSATEKADHKLLSASVDCITMLLMTVGREKNSDDTEQVAQLLIYLQALDLETADPMRIQVLLAWSRICKCLGKEFQPYMSVAIPYLLESAQLESYVVPEDPNNADESDERIKAMTLGDKRIWVRTNVLEEKAIACSVLHNFAAELKESIYLWIDEVAQTLLPLLEFVLDEEIRTAAVSAMPLLLKSSKAAIEKGHLKCYHLSPFKKLCAHVVPALVEALCKEPSTAIRVRILDSLDECLQMSGPILHTLQIKQFLDDVTGVIKASSSLPRSEMGDIDAGEQESLEEKNMMQEKVYDNAVDCLRTFIRTHTYSVSQFFEQLVPFIAPIWDSDKTDKDRKLALRIFHDVAKHCGEDAFRYCKKSLQFLFNGCYNENPEVQKAAAHAIGVYAEFGGPVFKKLVGAAISRLNAVIGHPKALHLEYIMAHDAAVAAIGKILQFHRDKVNAAEVFGTWLSHLPIKNDLNEAKVAHYHLCSIIEMSDKELLGREKANFPKIIAVYSEIFWAGDKIATEQTITQMINQLKHHRRRLPPKIWFSTLSSLEPHLERKLLSKLSS